MENIESPFIIEKKDKEIITNMRMIQYYPKNINIQLRLKDNIKSAEIIEMISSTSELLPAICNNTSTVQNPSCQQKKLISDKNKRIPLQFKFFPKKKGKYKYKLYLLTVINGDKRVIVTVEGNCIIQ